MFDFPHTFGPTTTSMPVPGTVSSVRSQKLLKPRMWIFFSFSMLSPGQQNTNVITEVSSGEPTLPDQAEAACSDLRGAQRWSTGANFTPEGESRRRIYIARVPLRLQTLWT
jgi:hypothetical protein